MYYVFVSNYWIIWFFLSFSFGGSGGNLTDDKSASRYEYNETYTNYAYTYTETPAGLRGRELQKDGFIKICYNIMCSYLVYLYVYIHKHTMQILRKVCRVY